jgi:RHS repeat-associated protein
MTIKRLLANVFYRESMIRCARATARRGFAASICLAGLWLGSTMALVAGDTRLLQQDILQALAKGEDASARLAQFQATGANRGTLVNSQRNSRVAEFSRQAGALGNLLARLSAKSELSPDDLRQLNHAVSVLQAEHLLFQDRFERLGRQLAPLATGGLQQRHIEVYDRYRTAVNQLFTALAGITAPADAAADDANDGLQQRVRRAMAEVAPLLARLTATPPRKILRNSLLPYRQSGYSTRLPQLEPVIVPSYAQAAAPATDSEDLNATLDAPLSQEILAKAKALDYDYIRIFDFVRGQVRTEWYASAMKGATGTLRQMSGNDIDQASLLIALLRASGLPTRYVHGVIELPIESILDSLALDTAVQAVQVLSKAGIAYTPQIRGGRIAAVHIEHTWLSAYMPYTNYRGAVIDAAGKSWLPMFPSLKITTHEPSGRILDAMSYDVDAGIKDYLYTSKADDLLDSIRADVENHLAQNDPERDYAELLGFSQLTVDDIGLIPHSLPVKVVAVIDEQAVLDDRYRQTIQFILRQSTRDNAAVILDYQLPVSQLASERVTLSYLPATVADQAIVNQFGGLDNVPAYLVQLRPQIKINGRLKMVASAGLEMASQHRFEILLHGPNGTEIVTQNVIVGGYHALAVQAGDYAPGENEDDPADTEYQAAQLLNRLAQSYSSAWSDAEGELAGLLDVAVIRPTPSVAIASNVYRVESLLGQPLQLEFTGVSLDAAYRLAQPIARDASSTAAVDWMRLAALQGSTLEAKIFRDLFLLDGLSADLGLRQAAAQSIPVLTIDTGNIAGLLPGLLHASEVLVNVQNWVRLGLTVTIPQTEIVYNDWQGSVWRAQDPQSGAAGYFISGGLAGGTTTEHPRGWLLGWLAAALTSSNGIAASNNALSVASLTKINTTDQQQGKVGETLTQQLSVLARDDAGLPVAGVEVTFSTSLGGGSFDDEEEGAGSIVALTNGAGIASASFTLGERTDINPRYKRLDAGDRYYSRVGLNLVEATANSYTGQVIVGSPFSAIAYPGEVTQLLRTNGHQPLGYPNQWAQNIILQPRDEFQNPIANIDVGFQISSQGNSCDPAPANVLPGAIFNSSLDAGGELVDSCPDNPVLGECGAQSKSLTSTIFGVNAGVILGNTTQTDFTVNVNAGGLSDSFEYKTLGGCRDKPKILVSVTSVSNAASENINATRAGEEFKRPVRVRVMLSEPAIESVSRGVPLYSSDSTAYGVNADVNFNVSNGGSSGAMSHPQTGEYEAKVTTGSTPGLNAVTTEVRNIVAPDYLRRLDDVSDNSQNARNHRVGVDKFLKDGINHDSLEIYGLEPSILGVVSPVPAGMDPDAIFVNDDYQAEFGAAILYQVLPGEYPGRIAAVDLYENGTLRSSLPAGIGSGVGSASVIRSMVFDPDNEHQAELVLNRGSSIEVISDPFEIKIGQRIFHDYSRSFISTLDIDTLNQRVCNKGSLFKFTTTQEARVTLEFTNRDNSDDVITIIDDDRYDEGEHEITITPLELYTGSYTFELKGVSTETNLTEIKEGGAYSHYRTSDQLAVGHTLVKGVNVFNGGLSLGSNDMSVPGRGVPLDFNRTYSSLSSEAPGILGYGWSHNYDSRIIITPCGEAIVIGAQGGGMRFVEDADGKLIPLKGYHGSLIPNFEDNSFDFYPKDGTRYHYVNLGISENKEWNLEYIEDTNGNLTKFGYDPGSRRKAKLITVEDAVGRTLNFTWEYRSFANFEFEPNEVIVAVDGPDGMRMDFEYDDFGNLIEASREDDSRVEAYTYSIDQDDFDLRHKLLTYTDSNGSETLYDYSEAELVVSADSISYRLPLAYTTEVEDPEGGLTRFDFSQLNGTDTTTVTNGRGHHTRYTMNDYGSVLSIDDPVGTKLMSWTPDDVLMTSRTDANGARTTYSHDEHGNVLNETVTGVGGNYTITRSYKSIPDKPWIKNRLATQSDRNGEVTRFDYDANGNLVEIIDAGSNITVYSYFANGDRASMHDPNGNDSFYRYFEDDYGNLSETIDALWNSTRMDWNERGLPVKRTDANGHKTGFEYDTLNRLVLQTDALGNTRSFDYDPVGNKLEEIDEEGRITRWSYDDENRVEVHTDALGNTMGYSYDDVGNQTSQTDWRGNTTDFAYDAADRLQTLTEPLGKITGYSYDPVGNRLTQTDAEGRVTRYSYDLLNRQITMIDALDGETRIDYDGVNRIAQHDPLGRVASFAYDRINRLVTQTEPLARITRFTYDGNGNQLSQTDANDHTQRTEYDALNRPVRTLDALNNETRFDYDPVGNRIRVIDARLHESHVEYDKLNRPVLSKDAGGFITRFEYDNVGNQTHETWPNGNVIDTEYDDLNRPLRRNDSLGQIGTTAYDENGNKTGETDANGNQTTHAYDALNRLSQSDLPEQRRLKYSYDLVGNQKTATDARNLVTRFDYDDLSRVVTVTDALNQSVASTYDVVGNRLSERDKRGNLTRFDYDDLNQLVLVTDALAQTHSTRYDPVGNPIGETDKRGTITEFSYDDLNRLIRTQKDNVFINSREYDEVGNVKFDTDANGNVSAFLYDERNLLITESRPLAAISQFTYDAMSDRLTVRDPEARTTTSSYDLRRRVTSESNGLGQTTSYIYDANGNRTGTARPLGNNWGYEYDGADRLTAITDGEGGITRFAYDKNSNRLSQTDAEQYKTSYTYDELNRQSSTTYMDGASESYGYDENGNRTRLTDAKGQVFTYAYDKLNRETVRSYPPPLASSGDDIQSIAMTYDENNNPLTITEQYSGATGTRLTVKTYDTFDRLLSVTDAFGKTIGYSYDANGNRTRLTDPDGKLTRYTYDELNRISHVATAEGISEYSYDRSSLQTRLDYPNGTRADNRYDDARRIEQIVNRQGAAVISQYDYVYDANGNRIAQTEINGGAAEVTTYSYDQNDRLDEVTYPDAVVEYELDANYNRTRELSTDPATSTLTINKTFAYNNRNQLQTVTDHLDASQNVVYQYDLNGNQTIKSKNGVTTTFIYDVRDQLRGVREDATTLGQYLYDYQGMRVAKTGDKGLVRYTYDDNSVLLQSDGSGNTLAKFEYGPDRLLSLDHTSEGRQFYHFDALGSTVNLSKPDASLQARYQYDTWGNFRSQSGDSFNGFTFTGHEKDTETDLYYFKARYYDPDTGRFLSQDSYLGEAQTPPSLHRYLYAYSNPTVYVDLFGYDATPLFHGQIHPETDIFSTVGSIDTLDYFNTGIAEVDAAGALIADNTIAALATVSNFGASTVNSISAGLASPFIVTSQLTGRSVESLESEYIATISSTGPVAVPLLMGSTLTGTTPRIALRQIRNLLRGKVDSNVRRSTTRPAIVGEAQQNGVELNRYDDLPPLAPEIESIQSTKTSVNDYLYRKDGRGAEIYADGGFRARNPDANEPLESYVLSNIDSQFIGTTKYKEVADQFSKGGISTNPKDGFVHVIDRAKIRSNQRDVNAEFPENPAFYEFEVAVEKEIPSCSIVGCYEVDESGKQLSDFIRNPDYEP